jgi:hypothetical protein
MTTPNETGRKVFQLLCDAGFSIDMSKILTAQSAHETSNFSSPVFKRNNNLFGMRIATSRKQDSQGDTDKDSYANYSSLSQSISDIGLYIKARQLDKVYNSCDDYVDAIHQKGYFEASLEEYKKEVNRFYKLYFNA